MGVTSSRTQLSATCDFWPDCDTTYKYDGPGAWEPCSASCWSDYPNPATKPHQERSLECTATKIESGKVYTVLAAECEAAGLPHPGDTHRWCNTERCDDEPVCPVRFCFCSLAAFALSPRWSPA